MLNKVIIMGQNHTGFRVKANTKRCIGAVIQRCS